MALTINGTHITSGSTVMVNGQAVNRLVCNGVEVWNKSRAVNFNKEVSAGPVLPVDSSGSWIPSVVKVTPSGNSLILSISGQAHSSVTNIIFRIDSVSLNQLKLILQSGPAQTSGNTWIYNRYNYPGTIGEEGLDTTYDLTTLFNWRGDLEIYGSHYIHSLYSYEYGDAFYLTSLNPHPTAAEIAGVEDEWGVEVTEVYSTEVPSILEIILHSRHQLNWWYDAPTYYEFNIGTSNTPVLNGWKMVGYTPAATRIGVGSNTSQLVYL